MSWAHMLNRGTHDYGISLLCPNAGLSLALRMPRIGPSPYLTLPVRLSIGQDTQKQ